MPQGDPFWGQCEAKGASIGNNTLAKYKEIGHAIVHDCFSITEGIIMKDLEFCPRGGFPGYEEEGFFNMNGQLGVNVDGGLKYFGHFIGASGIRMIYGVYKQLQGKAGPRPRKNP